MGMEIQNVNPEVRVPAGEYYLGDPCYAVPDEHWMALLESCDYFNDPVGKVAGHEVLAFHTAHGDGTYQDDDGNKYPVDAGLIGLVPVGLTDETTRGEMERAGCSRLVTFSRPVLCRQNNGLLVFGPIEIETD